MKLSMKFLFAILAVFTVTAIAAHTPDVVEGAKALIYGHGELLALAATSPVISLNTYAGQYEQKLFTKLVNGMQATEDVTVLRNVKSKLQMTKLTIDDGARPYTPKEQIRATMNYGPRVLETSLWKREEEIEIKKYQNTFMEYKMQPGLNAEQRAIPFAEFTWNAFIQALSSEINNKTIWHGFDKSDATAYAAGSTYAPGDYITFTAADGFDDYWKCVTATTAGQSPTTHAAKWQKVNAEAIAPGFAARIAADITAGKTAETIGAITSSDGVAYTAFSTLYRKMPEPYRNHPLVAYCSYTDYDFLRDDLEKTAKYVERDRQSVNRGIFLPKTDNQLFVLPCTWMKNTRRIVVTPRENMLIGTDQFNKDVNTIAEVKSELWTVKYGISGNIGMQIRDVDAYVINDQI